MAGFFVDAFFQVVDAVILAVAVRIKVFVGIVHDDGLAVFIHQLPAGAGIAGGRALLLLEAQGLIKLDDSSNLTATPNNIVENPKNLEFQEVEAATIPSILADVDLAVINSNYALGAGLNPVKDALAIESKDSPYANIVAIRTGDDSRAEIQKLKAALTSAEVKKFIETEYKGAVVPAF